MHAESETIFAILGELDPAAVNKALRNLRDNKAVMAIAKEWAARNPQMRVKAYKPADQIAVFARYLK